MNVDIEIPSQKPIFSEPSKLEIAEENEPEEWSHKAVKGFFASNSHA